MLAGLTVIDLSQVGPASRCTAVLADLGARVIKVLPPASSGRIEPPSYAYGAGRGTEPIEIDLRNDRDRYLSLCDEADVVVESFRPGVADRLGIGYETLRARNPRIVYCATTGYGQDGPYAAWAGHDLNYLAVGGYLATQGTRADGGPALPGATIADSAGGGFQAAIRILAALVARATSGEGVYVDVSTTEGVLSLMSLQIDQYLATGEGAGPGTTLLTGRYACYDVYPARDGRWLAVGAIERKFFENLCRALGRDQIAPLQYDDARQDDVRAALREAFATRDRDDWVAELAPMDTCVSPVLSISELVDDPHLRARGAFIDSAYGFEQLGPVMA